MIFKLHKIPDKTFFKAIFLIIALWNLKYFFLPLQVPFTMITKDFIWENSFYSEVFNIRKQAERIKSFQDEGVIGFVSDVPQGDVFDLPQSIRSFYIAQYAVIPSILKNDTDADYLIAARNSKFYILNNKKENK